MMLGPCKYDVFEISSVCIPMGLNILGTSLVGRGCISTPAFPIIERSLTAAIFQRSGPIISEAGRQAQMRSVIASTALEIWGIWDSLRGRCKIEISPVRER